MRIAVTYEDGNVFQHFGRTENFKVYDVEDGKVVSSGVVSSNGEGHGALAGVLADNKVDVLICGGLGGGAQTALKEAGIEVCAGAEGDTDAAVEAYLKGELVDTGANCDHHDHEHGEDHVCGDHGCGGHDHVHEEPEEFTCGGNDGQGCAGCSGCGPMEPLFEGKNAGKKVRVHYRGTFNDGEQFDASYDRGEPLEFLCAMGMMIPGFDRAVVDMEKGDVVDIHLMPEDAYGEHRPEMIITVEKQIVDGSGELQAGDQVVLTDQIGRPFNALVTDVDDVNITFDCNHPMAGKELNFRIELVDVE